jgi:hypothetical protein
MVWPALRFQVGEARLTVVVDRVDVVPFEPVAPSTARLGALDPLERRRCAELERSPQLGGDVAAEVGDRVDLDPVVQHGLQERVGREVAGHLDRDRSAADERARLAVVGMPSPKRLQIDDDHEVGPRRVTLALTRHHVSKRVGGVRLALLERAAGLSCSAPRAVGLGVQPVHERDADLRR